jgi:hypothetical protein
MQFAASFASWYKNFKAYFKLHESKGESDDCIMRLAQTDGIIPEMK